MTRLLLSLVLIFSWAVTPAQAAYAKVQCFAESGGPNLGGTADTVTAFNSGSADLITAVLSSYAAAANAVVSTDSYSNSYSSGGQSTSASSTARAEVWFSKPTMTGASHTLTVTGIAVYWSIQVCAWTGSHASPLGTSQAGSSESTTTLAAGTFTPAQCSMLVVHGVALANEHASGPTTTGVDEVFASPALASTSEGVGGAYTIQDDVTPVNNNPTWTWGGDTIAAAAISVSFKSTDGTCSAGSSNTRLSGSLGMSGAGF